MHAGTRISKRLIHAILIVVVLARRLPKANPVSSKLCANSRVSVRARVRGCVRASVHICARASVGESGGRGGWRWILPLQDQQHSQALSGRQRQSGRRTCSRMGAGPEGPRPRVKAQGASWPARQDNRARILPASRPLLCMVNGVSRCKTERCTEQ